MKNASLSTVAGCGFNSASRHILRFPSSVFLYSMRGYGSFNANVVAHHLSRNRKHITKPSQPEGGNK